MPGKRYWFPEFSRRMLATRLAAGALSGRCSVRLCLVWWEGLIRTPSIQVEVSRSGAQYLAHSGAGEELQPNSVVSARS